MSCDCFSIFKKIIIILTRLLAFKVFPASIAGNTGAGYLCFICVKLAGTKVKARGTSKSIKESYQNSEANCWAWKQQDVHRGELRVVCRCTVCDELDSVKTRIIHTGIFRLKLFFFFFYKHVCSDWESVQEVKDSTETDEAFLATSG